MIVKLALQSLAQVRYMHWMTTNYVVHKELGNLYEKLDGFLDRLVESFLGTNTEYNTVLKFSVHPPTRTGGYSNVLIDIKQKFKNVRESLDSALQNVIDEITGSIDQTLYLLAMA